VTCTTRQLAPLLFALVGLWAVPACSSNSGTDTGGDMGGHDTVTPHDLPPHVDFAPDVGQPDFFPPSDLPGVDAPIDVASDVGPDGPPLADGPPPVGPQPTVAAAFDPSVGQFPEGLFLGTATFVSLQNGTVVTVDSNGQSTVFGAVPNFTGGGLVLLGIVQDAAGNVYVGAGRFGTGSAPTGIYKMTGAGADGTLFASDANLNFPNGLVLDSTGTSIYVADSGGTVFQVSTVTGTVTTLSSNTELAGDMGQTCAGMAVLPFPIGINGMVLVGTDLWMVNTSLGSIITVPTVGTSAGTASVVKQDCGLFGADGLAVDTDGRFYVANNLQGQIQRVTADGMTFADYSSGPGYENPASIAIDTSVTPHLAYITNFALFQAMGSQHPGLLTLPIQ
jgi:hypothetical protein